MVHGLETIAAMNDRAIAAHQDKWVHVEQVEWFPICPDHMPDCDLTVMLVARGSGEPAWPGYYDDSDSECWRNADGSRVKVMPTHWAEMLDGPK